MRFKIKSTLSKKLILLFSAILISVVALNVCISMVMLEKVYFQSKISDMKSSYEVLDAECEREASTENITKAVKELISYNNMRVFIWDEADNLIIDSVPILRIEDSEGEQAKPPMPPSPNGGKRREHQEGRKGEFFIFNADVKKDDLIFKNDDYSIISFSNFDNLGQESLYLRGTLSGGRKVLLQVPISPMKEAVTISNYISIIIGIIVLIIGVLIVLIAAKRIARPVTELSQIADAMQNLDFSKKYSGTRSDEIGSLGKSVNLLSEKLESTIGELKEKNEMLQRDNELKEHIDEMRREFIANASHELKTPAALILGYAEGLKDNIAADEKSRAMYTDVIIDETKKMDQIIHQMLDLMELEEKKEVLNAEIFSLSGLMKDVLQSCRVLMENKDVKLKCSFDDVSVSGDSRRIYQAALNYVTNAVNHVDENKIIEVKVKDEGEYAYFGVYNSGKEIAKEDMDRIWEKFYKVDKARTRAYGGTGLGLSIVSSTIKLHKGQYGVINCGSGVEFYFRLRKENADDEQN